MIKSLRSLVETFILFVIASSFLAFTYSANAQSNSYTTYIIGDSIGVGMSWAAGPKVKTFAKNGTPIATTVDKRMLYQISAVPNGATVVVSLGTNDASYGNFDIFKLEPQIDLLIKMMQDKKLRIIWVGPPCVGVKWNKNSEMIDALLKRKLGITYVSTQSGPYCSKPYYKNNMRANDQIHFNFNGYKHLWGEARKYL